MSILLVLAAIIVGLPLLLYARYLIENARAGLLPLACELCGGSLAWPLVRTMANSAWSVVLVVLAYPLGWLPERSPKPFAPGGLPPVILIHGLYHNTSAWFLFRQRLLRAGFGDVRCYGYPSFFRPFEAIVEGLVQQALQAAEASPTGQVLLVGHSLGGLLSRCVCASPVLAGRIAGILTLGTPHQGSTLAGLLAVGRLGRGLVPGGAVLEFVRRQPVCAVPGLSLYSPLDGMVLPLSGLFLEDREKQAGWTEVCLPPVSHVGLLYDPRVSALGVEFLRAAAGSR